MSLRNIVSGVVLVGAMGAGCLVWMATSYVPGAATFVAGALIAGLLHEKD